MARRVIAPQQSSAETVCSVERLVDGVWKLVAFGRNALTNGHRQMYAEFIAGQDPSLPSTIYAGVGAVLTDIAYAGSTIISLDTTVGLNVGADLIIGDGTSKAFRSTIRDVSAALVTLETPLPYTYSDSGEESHVVVESSTAATVLQSRIGDPVTVSRDVFLRYWGRMSGTFPTGQPPVPTGETAVNIREMGLFDGEFTSGNIPRLISRVVVNYSKQVSDAYRVEFRSRLLP